MYCHQYKENAPNLLNRGFSKNVKKLSRHPLCNVEFMQKTIQFEITARMFYVYEDYHKVAHGTFSLKKWSSLLNAIDSLGNNGEGVDMSILLSHSKSVHLTPTIKLAYPGSECISDFEILNLSHGKWLNLILSKGKVGDNRDLSQSSKFTGTKRLTFGWSQIQCRRLPKTYTYNNELMPYPSFPIFRGKDILPPCLKIELGKIMSLSQVYLDEFYGVESKMCNKLRNNLFGSVLGRSFWQSSVSRFEFITIFAECESIVGRHVDYMNAKDDDYNVGCSYSYLIWKDGDLYRVNFVMSNRHQIDSFMKKMKT